MTLLVTETREGVTVEAFECSTKRSQKATFVDLCKQNGVPVDRVDIDNQYKALPRGEGTITMIETRKV